MLMTESDQKVFTENLKSFLKFWGEREPRFIAYFKQNYISRTGENFTD